jgi:hypothetical protein
VRVRCPLGRGRCLVSSQTRATSRHPGLQSHGGTGSQYWHSWARTSLGQEKARLVGPGIPADIIYEPLALLKLSLSGEATIPCPSDLLFRKECIVNLGGFEESFVGVLSMFEDQSFFAKVYSNLPVSGRFWFRYRRHADSLCATVGRAGHWSRRNSPYFCDQALETSVARLSDAPRGLEGAAGHTEFVAGLGGLGPRRPQDTPDYLSGPLEGSGES